MAAEKVKAFQTSSSVCLYLPLNFNFPSVFMLSPERAVCFLNKQKQKFANRQTSRREGGGEDYTMAKCNSLQAHRLCLHA